MIDTALALMYLFVSLESVAIQVVSLFRLRGKRRDAVHRYLVRTVWQRVIVMSSYVGLGIYNLLLDRGTLSVVALALFTAVSIAWQINSLDGARLNQDRANGRPHE